MEEQCLQLKNEFINWQGNQEQVDDVCFVGIKF
jgi:serine phosphatase RsbU (regulator of sigma subunit)